ncbi:hypothetical protein ANO14919_128780 [Xylariales sp. No.14919]|nr:hypothetical protein ANO14919_128780 [Xylariales sp. No.14919]
MEEINREIGLTAMIQGFGASDSNHDGTSEKKSKEEVEAT